jgi:hypothetical protein
MIILLPSLALRRISVNRNQELDGLQIRGRQIAMLAHDLLADLSAPIGVAHAGARNRGPIIFPVILRPYEAKALWGIENLDCTCSRIWIWPPLKPLIGVCVPHDIVQPGVRNPPFS